MNILIFLLGFLPGFAWLFFYLQEDLHPEPKRLIAKTFLFGASFAFLALFFQIFVDCSLVRGPVLCRNEYSGSVTTAPLFLIIFALIEEVLKFLAAYFAVHKNSAFNEPVDAMIYTIVAAMGFATIENLGALSSGLEQGVGILSSSLELISLRFIGATLLHSVTAGIIGYYWAISIRDFNTKRFVVEGIIVATIVHALFNYFILNYETIIAPILLVTLAGFFILNDFEKLKVRGV